MKRVMNSTALQSGVSFTPNLRQQLKQHSCRITHHLRDLVINQPTKVILTVTTVALMSVLAVTKITFASIYQQGPIRLTLAQVMVVVALATVLLVPIHVFLITHFTRKLHHLRSQLAQQVQTDHLTQLKNRQYFVTRVGELLADPSLAHSCMSLMILDIDHFRQLVATYGLTESDTVVQQVAAIGNEVFRPTDMACRFSTNRIAVLMRDTTMSEARVLGDRVRQRILNQFAHLRLPITISGGVSAYNGGDSLTHWIQRIERLVGEAKSTGGNCIRVSNQTRIDLPPLSSSRF